jgi:hypothetical protein
MSRNWRITPFSGALLAAYFIPTWAMVAYEIIVSPVRGLYELPSVSIALFASDHLQLSSITMVRFAWLLALGRLTVVAFLLLFAVSLLRGFIRRTGGGNEPLAIALVIGSIISFASMLMASKVGEVDALRLHASELLAMLGTTIVMLFDNPSREPADTAASSSNAEQAELGYNS